MATIVALLCLYFGDWALWRMRTAHGQGVGHASVSRFVVAPLKGNKEEYYYDGTAEVACTHSLFPQAAGNPCWWVVRQPTVFER